MISSTSVFVALTFALSLTAKAQSISIPAGATLPAACNADCAQSLSVIQTCQTQYAATNQTIPCVCNGLPSNLATCATCLNSNGGAAIASQLASLGTTCPTALAGCSFQCNFTPCAATDQACMCTPSYLQNVLNCAGCNAAKGLTGTVSLDQYKTLAQSCLAAGVAAVPTVTQNLPSPSGATAPQAAPPASAAAASTAVSSAAAAATSAAAAGSTSASHASHAASSSAAAAAASGAASSASKAASSSVSVQIPAATGGASRLTTGAAVIPAVLLGAMLF